MFTQKEFQLSEFINIGNFNVIRDCLFQYAGKIGTNLNSRLVACRVRKHVEAAVVTPGISGVIVPLELLELVPDELGVAVATDPVIALNQVQSYLSSPVSGQWQDFKTKIHRTALISSGVHIAPWNVEICEGVVIHPNAVILSRVRIGPQSSIGPSSVVGTDAFEVDTSSSPAQIIAQSGGVQIGSDVDIQAKCTIVRATFGGFTEIGNETKLDCQVHLAHDCHVGKRVRIAACAEISGRVHIGDEAFIGPNVSISNGCRIGSRAHVTIGAVVTRDVEDGARVTGNFAVDHQRWLNFMRNVR